MRVILGADHAGFEIKKKILNWLSELEIESTDVGAYRLNLNDDFVDYAEKGVKALRDASKDNVSFLVLLCRNGVGMSIAANRFSDVRCVLGFNKEQVRRARSDDDVNCLALPVDYLSFEKQVVLLEVFLRTNFDNKERYKRRLERLGKL